MTSWKLAPACTRLTRCLVGPEVEGCFLELRRLRFASKGCWGAASWKPGEKLDPGQSLANVGACSMKATALLLAKEGPLEKTRCMRVPCEAQGQLLANPGDGIAGREQSSVLRQHLGSGGPTCGLSWARMAQHAQASSWTPDAGMIQLSRRS